MRTPNERSRTLLFCLWLALAIAAVYWPVASYNFVCFDDTDYVSENSMVKKGLTLQGLAWAFTDYHSCNWHPLTWLSHMLDCQLFGLNAGWHHVTSLLLHALNSVLLFLLLKRLTGAFWRCAIVAALFALHPLRAESVVWISERKDVLSLFFCLLTLWSYSGYAQQNKSQAARRNKDYGLALIFFALGLMSKSMLVTLPFLLLLLDFWPLQRFQAFGAQGTPPDNSAPQPTPAFPLRAWTSLVVEKIPFFVLAGVFSAVTFAAQKGGGAIVSSQHITFGQRFANAAISYLRYIEKSFWPHDLIVIYVKHHGWPVFQAVAATLLLLMVSLWVILRGRRQPWLPTGWFWYLGTLVPVIGLVQVGSQAMADRYTYLPSIGLLIALVWTLHAIPWTRCQRFKNPLLGFAATMAVVACAQAACLQRSYWENSELLFTHAVEVDPQNKIALKLLAIARSNTGMDLLAQGKRVEAFKKLQSANQANCKEAENNLGVYFYGEGNLAEAEKRFNAALKIEPNYASALVNLATVLKAQGKLAEARDCILSAFKTAPDDALGHSTLASILDSEGHAKEAIVHYQKAIDVQPNDPVSQNNFAALLLRTGRTEESLFHFKAAVELQPENVTARYNLASVLAQQGKLADAMAQYRRILSFQPNMVPALQRLAWALATSPQDELRNGSLALSLAQSGRNLTGGKDPQILAALDVAYAELGRFDEAIAAAQQSREAAASSNMEQLMLQADERINCYRAKHPFRAQ